MQQEQILQRQPIRRTHFVFFAIILIPLSLVAGFVGSSVFSMIGGTKNITSLNAGQDGNKIVSKEEEAEEKILVRIYYALNP